MASSIHIAKINSGSFLHNDRTVKPSYLIDDSSLNEVSVSADEALNNFHKLKLEAQQNYTMRTGQKMQKSVIFLKEAIINLEKHHTLKDLEPIKNKLEKYGFKVLQMSIHRDEGFLSQDDNKKKKNYHAHISMFNLDVKTGKTVKFGKNYRSELSKLQTFVAKTLGMERGKVSVKEEAERLNAPVQKASRRLDTHQYKRAMKIKEKETQRLKLNIKQLKSELETEKKLMPEAKNYTTEDYRSLSHLQMITNTKTISDIFSIFVGMREDRLRHKNEITILQQEKETIQKENESLKQQNKQKTLQQENEQKTLRQQYETIQQEKETIQKENESLKQQNKQKTLQQENEQKTLRQQYETIQQEKETIQKAYDEMQVKHDEIVKEKATIQSKYETLRAKYDETQINNESLRHQNKTIQSKYETLRAKYDETQINNESLRNQNDTIQSKNDKLINENESLKNTALELKSKLTESYDNMVKLTKAYESMKNEQQPESEPEPKENNKIKLDIKFDNDRTITTKTSRGFKR